MSEMSAPVDKQHDDLSIRRPASPCFSPHRYIGTQRQFPDNSTAPARFTFQAAALLFGAKIEVQAVAARGT